MCIFNQKNTLGKCFVCLKLKNLLKIHFRIHHRKSERDLCDTLTQQLKKHKKAVKNKKRSSHVEEEDTIFEKDLFDGATDNEFARDVENSITKSVYLEIRNADIDNYSSRVKPLVKIEDISQNTVAPVVIKPNLQNKEMNESQKRKSKEIKSVPEPKKSLSRQVLTEVEKVHIYTCDMCQEQFRFQRGLTRHLRSVHGKEKKSDPDHVNNRKSLNASQENSEQLSQVVDAKGKYVCSLCEKRFMKKGNIVNHYALEHGQVITDVVKSSVLTNEPDANIVSVKRKRPRWMWHNCQRCDKRFQTASQLAKHMVRHRSTNEKPYLCDLCGAGFTTNPSLATHIKQHLGQDLEKCDTCGKEFATKTRLQAHLRIHTGERPFSCEYCGRSFSSLSSLKPHIRTHTGEKPFKCPLCPYSSTVRNGVKQHMVHHDESLQMFSCHICGKSMRYRAKLNAHLKKHAGQYRHFCEICNKGFYYRNEVVKHMNCVHTQTRPFACEYCDQTYKRKTHLTRHVQNSHPNVHIKNENENTMSETETSASERMIVSSKPSIHLRPSKDTSTIGQKFHYVTIIEERGPKHQTLPGIEMVGGLQLQRYEQARSVADSELVTEKLWNTHSTAVTLDGQVLQAQPVYTTRQPHLSTVETVLETSGASLVDLSHRIQSNQQTTHLVPADNALGLQAPDHVAGYESVGEWYVTSGNESMQIYLPRTGNPATSNPVTHNLI